MAHLPGTPHVARIAGGWTYGAQQCENTFYVSDSTDAIFTDPDGFCASVATAWETNMIPVMYGQQNFNEVVFEDVRDIPFVGLVHPVTPAVEGDLTTSSPLPANLALAIKRSTGALGRSGRGRLYWQIVADEVISAANFVETGYANDVVAALQGFQTDVEAISGTVLLGINSYFQDNVMRSAGLFQQIIGWSVTDYVVDSMRKRLPGRGR